MTERDFRHEVKEILKEATFWPQTEDLNLAVEKLNSVIDREATKAKLESKNYDDQRSHIVPIRFGQIN